MSYKIYQNGFYLDENRAHVSLHDRGFLLGEGLFETLRATQGHVLFFEEHYSRLSESARVLDLKLPVSSARLKFLTYEMLHMNKLSEAVVRVFVSTEGAALGDYDEPPKQVNLIISCRPFQGFPPEAYQRGEDAVIVKDLYAEKGALGSIKSLSYLNRILARRQARARGAFEGILLNADGQVAEGSGSNIFAAQKGILYTPPGDQGLLPGVTRAQIFKIAEKEKIPLHEKPLSPEDLQGAEEIFLTSTLKNVMPVKSLEGRPLKAPGPLTHLMMELYRDWVQWNVEKYLSEMAGLTELP